MLDFNLRPYSKNNSNFKENTNKLKCGVSMDLKYVDKMVVPAMLNCTFGKHFYKNSDPNDIKLL